MSYHPNFCVRESTARLATRNRTEAHVLVNCINEELIAYYFGGSFVFTFIKGVNWNAEVLGVIREYYEDHWTVEALDGAYLQDACKACNDRRGTSAAYADYAAVRLTPKVA